MRFKLTQKTATEFRVEDERGDVIVSVSLSSPQEVSDFLRCWGGTVDRGEQKPKLKAPPPLMGRMPRQMVLRGC
jgi:hypothetical protein